MKRFKMPPDCLSIQSSNPVPISYLRDQREGALLEQAGSALFRCPKIRSARDAQLGHRCRRPADAFPPTAWSEPGIAVEHGLSATEALANACTEAIGVRGGPKPIWAMHRACASLCASSQRLVW